jgi:hypothetical protein
VELEHLKTKTRFIDKKFANLHISVSILVVTTAGSSAAGVELPTDDCRQPAGITDENSFFFIFLWWETRDFTSLGDPFFPHEIS